MGFRLTGQKSDKLTRDSFYNEVYIIAIGTKCDEEISASKKNIQSQLHGFKSIAGKDYPVPLWQTVSL
jgi:hypothetical protein